MAENDNEPVNKSDQPDVAYEDTGLDPRPVIKFAAGLVAIGIVSFVLLWGLLGIFERQSAASRAREAVPARGEREHLPPEPRLQIAPGSKTALKTPDYEMKEVEQQWRRDLSSYGWINKNSGTVRIPIDEAERLLLQRGVPTLEGRGDRATR